MRWAKHALAVGCLSNGKINEIWNKEEDWTGDREANQLLFAGRHGSQTLNVLQETVACLTEFWQGESL